MSPELGTHVLSVTAEDRPLSRHLEGGLRTCVGSEHAASLSGETPGHSVALSGIHSV